MTIKFQATDNIEQCLEIRHKVFILGQNVPPDREIDGLDDRARHYIGLDQDRPVATCRIRFIKETAKIERVAVLADCRGQGIGRKLMDYVITALTDDPGVKVIKLSAQMAVVPLYEALGFTSYGDPYLDAGITHMDMQRPARP